MKKLIYIIFVLFLLTSCRIVKKDWLKENYVAKNDLEKTVNNLEETHERDFSKIASEYQVIKTDLSNIETTKTNESETETITVSGTIKAEEGKEKTAIIGNTKITSNGADISFKVENSKAFTQAFESIKNQFETYKSETSEVISSLQKDLTQKSQIIETLTQDIKTLKTEKSRTVTKKQLGFGVIILLILIVVGYLLLKRFKLI